MIQQLIEREGRQPIPDELSAEAEMAWRQPDATVHPGAAFADKTSSRLYLSIVIPCFNEQEVLLSCYERVRNVCEQFLKPYELVFVNDGSTDATWDLLQELARQDRHVVAVNLSRNFGQQRAVTAGLSAARGEFVALLDADLQDPPELFPAMLQLSEEQGADVVYGVRRHRAGETWLKTATAAAFYRGLSWLSDTPIPRNTGDFRVLRRRVVEAVLNMPEQCRFLRGMISWAGFRQVPISYDRDARQAGVTKWPMHRMIGLALDAIAAFSIKPVRLAAALGLISVVAAAGVPLAIAISPARSTLWGQICLGILCALIPLAGAQLVLLSVVAEYVGRIHGETLRRPLYLISDIVRSKPKH